MASENDTQRKPRRPKADDDRAWLNPWIRNGIVALSGVVMLGLVVADSLDQWLCGCDITIGPMGMALGFALLVLVFNFKLSDWRGGKDD